MNEEPYSAFTTDGLSSVNVSNGSKGFVGWSECEADERCAAAALSRIRAGFSLLLLRRISFV